MKVPHSAPAVEWAPPGFAFVPDALGIGFWRCQHCGTHVIAGDSASAAGHLESLRCAGARDVNRRARDGRVMLRHEMGDALALEWALRGLCPFDVPFARDEIADLVERARDYRFPARLIAPVERIGRALALCEATGLAWHLALEQAR